MAIKKKGNVDYLNNVTPASLSLNDADSSVSNRSEERRGGKECLVECWCGGGGGG